MKKQIDYAKLWMFVGIIALLIVVVSQCESNTTLEKSVLAEVKQSEKKDDLFVKKNEHLQEQQVLLQKQLQDVITSKRKIENKLQKVRTITKVVVDTTIANKYLKDRYKNNSIQVVNDLIQYDVCKADNIILEDAIVNRDSIIDLNTTLYKNEK